jgi:hypothetical protein
MQLSAKALLRPFNCIASASGDDELDIDDNGNDDMPTLSAVDEDDDGDEADVDEDDVEDTEVDDLLDSLDDEEREQLIQDTDAVRTTLNKVSYQSSHLILFVLIYIGRRRFASCHLLLSIPPQSVYLRGVMLVPCGPFVRDSSLAMSKLGGTPPTICSMSLWSTAMLLMTSLQTNP